MPGGDLAYNPPNLKGNTAVEKLRYFLTDARAKIRKLGLDSGSKMRFRGDVLEISVDRSELTQDQNYNANDSLIYIKTGLLISILTKSIIEAGLRPVVRTFPRFDEPDLVGFVYIGDEMVSRRRTKSSAVKGESNKRIENYDLIVAENIAAKRSLGLSVVKGEDRLQTVCSALREGLDCCKAPGTNSELRKLIDDIGNPELENSGRNVLIVSSRQNTPTAWIGTGFFLGEMICEMKDLQKTVYPLSLKSCPSQFQKQLRDVTEGSARYPQLVCIIDSENEV